MKAILHLFLFTWAITVHGQIKSVSLQAGGLTCSMCSNAINKALKTLDFVDKVDADINTYTFLIFFKANTGIDFDQIKNKVEKAGFTVSSFTAYIHFENTTITGQEGIVIDHKRFLFPALPDSLLQGVLPVKIIDRGFVSGKAYSRNPQASTPSQTYHASL